MMQAAGAELRFVNHLIDRGYPLDSLEFAGKKSQDETAVSEENYDIDAIISSRGDTEDYIYQVKRLDLRGDTIEGSQLVNNSAKIGKQLRVPGQWPNTRVVGIIEANAPLGELKPQQYNNILKNAQKHGITYHIYHPGGRLTIPPGAQVFPD
ncbi:hypothetical protein ACFPZ0_07400 [Streptomonospora nanhaiensis]|uniref:hypothetical protein n=1 Tax=Streptomonospora nanhaiensis TaxID=1323731 RepID=UPI001C98FF94|nr:hypothetical protein [Streptomonospora nanhaiensis]MBX9387862.1 hypothetical protein [Streptomonospora nanhaiensis]